MGVRSHEVANSNPQSASPQSAQSLALGAREARTCKIAVRVRNLNCAAPSTTSISTLRRARLG
eukprot:15471296-Alexandrium_andersonii.AAC.1